MYVKNQENNLHISLLFPPKNPEICYCITVVLLSDFLNAFKYQYLLQPQKTFINQALSKAMVSFFILQRMFIDKSINKLYINLKLTNYPPLSVQGCIIMIIVIAQAQICWENEKFNKLFVVIEKNINAMNKAHFQTEMVYR